MGNDQLHDLLQGRHRISFDQLVQPLREGLELLANQQPLDEAVLTHRDDAAIERRVQVGVKFLQVIRALGRWGLGCGDDALLLLAGSHGQAAISTKRPN
ncbi:hypothetical protein EGJ23_00615 [Pseudomonas sp. o96-267]|nr:hypothetical protein EGJ23_00615 [Pseudomonas sp. o96-267]